MNGVFGRIRKRRLAPLTVLIVGPCSAGLVMAVVLPLLDLPSTSNIQAVGGGLLMGLCLLPFFVGIAWALKNNNKKDRPPTSSPTVRAILRSIVVAWYISLGILMVCVLTKTEGVILIISGVVAFVGAYLGIVLSIRNDTNRERMQKAESQITD